MYFVLLFCFVFFFQVMKIIIFKREEISTRNPSEKRIKSRQQIYKYRYKEKHRYKEDEEVVMS